MEYQSCDWLRHGINFELQHIEICCFRCHEGGGNVYLKEPFDGKKVDWEQIKQRRNLYIQENKNGIINSKCKGCFNLTTKEWDDNDNDYIKYIHFNHWTLCNADCFYCYTHDNKSYYNNVPHYRVLPVLEDMFEHFKFAPDGEITFAGGEPTVLDEFDDIINLLIDKGAKKITIHSSGIKFSQAIQDGIKKGVVSVVISQDAGSSKVYSKIKNSNSFDKVFENTKKYALVQPEDNKSLVQSKYIIIPQINDSKSEIKKWFNLSYESGVRTIVLDIEHNWFNKQREKKQMPEQMLKFINYISSLAENKKVHVVLFNMARYLVENPMFFDMGKTFHINPLLLKNPGFLLEFNAFLRNLKK